MTEDGGGGLGEDQGRTLDWSSFVVDETPHCMWAIGLREQNLRFLRGIDPTFYRYLSETHHAGLDGTARKNAALAMRLAYAQALETFFALLAAAIQAPNCPLGWMLMYETRQLYSVVRKIAGATPLLTRYVTRPVTWDSLSRDIHLFKLEDAAEERRIKELFATSWAMLAHDFVDKAASDEYNSIKHGLRVQTAGFNLTIHSPEASKSPTIASRSEFGTRFFSAESLSDKWRNFYALDAARNWTPVALAVRMEIIALSINNLISYLRAKLVDVDEPVQFLWPVQTDALALAWQNEHVIESMRGGLPMEAADISPLSAAQIVEGYEPVEPMRSEEQDGSSDTLSGDNST